MDGARPHFKYLGSFGYRRTLRKARLKIPMGLRRRIRVVVDDPRGVLVWSLTYKSLPDTLNGPILDDGGNQISKAEYIWMFWDSLTAAGGSTFTITCLQDGKKYLVEFEDDELSFEMIATKLYTSSLNLIQVDVADQQTLDDGSLGEDTGNPDMV
jgi:hypothetical protein